MNLTKLQVNIIEYIKENPYCRILEIVEDLEINRNVASRILHILDEKELIEFTFDPSSCTSSIDQAAVFESGWILRNE